MADAAPPDQRVDLTRERGAPEQAVRHRRAGQDGLRKRERARCPAHFDRQAFAKGCHLVARERGVGRSEEHTSELQSLMRISYAVFCLKKNKETITTNTKGHQTDKH